VTVTYTLADPRPWRLSSAPYTRSSATDTFSGVALVRWEHCLRQSPLRIALTAACSRVGSSLSQRRARQGGPDVGGRCDNLKRDQSIAGLDQLPNYRDDTFRSWVLAKMLLTEIALQVATPRVHVPLRTLTFPAPSWTAPFAAA
jgi:hypothetical protein